MNPLSQPNTDFEPSEFMVNYRKPFHRACLYVREFMLTKDFSAADVVTKYREQRRHGQRAGIVALMSFGCSNADGVVLSRLLDENFATVNTQDAIAS